MFPYPSASFLHMGHVRNYAIGDTITRFKRLCGFNVLYPMGYDSFGLPAENAAKKQKIHPREYTEGAIDQIMRYQKDLGLSYDWDRIIATHRPQYYKWNQYFFIKFFEKGLAYRKKAAVNYCEHCNTVLANEEVEAGKCWRCENDVVQKELDQWFLKTTAYADELLRCISDLGWSDKIKAIQENWIGKSQGVMIDFHIDNNEKTLFPIFTTRPDTIFGVTFMVIALDHPRLQEYIDGTPYEDTVKKFVDESRKAKISDDKDFLEKAGVFTGIYAINPLNNERVPVYAGNFVVADYASGMIMAVPAHDQRDFEFAKKHNIPVRIVIQDDKESLNAESMDRAYTDEGHLTNSGSFNGLHNKDAIERISGYIEKNGLGRLTINYKLRDWLISRQRYWGTPIPIVYCGKCGAVPLNEKDLPLLLPDDVQFEDKGNPLLTSKSFLNAVCPKCGGAAKPETDTMGGFMDSSWYFLRYCSPKTVDVPFSKDAADYWLPVDQYIGGIEHAVGHLIYSRFFTKALRDMGLVSVDEPFMNLFNQGIVYKDGHKMSKSYGNIVTQDEISSRYGIDTARLFMLFVASPDKEMEWSDQGVEGSFKMIMRMYRIFEEFSEDAINSSSSIKDDFLRSRRSLAIKSISSAIDDFKLNNAIIHLMEFINYLADNKELVSRPVLKETLEMLAIIINPFMPHISEECHEMIGGKGFASTASWPIVDDSMIRKDLHYLEDMISCTKKDIYSVLSLAKIDKPSEIRLIIAEPWKYDLIFKIRDSSLTTRNSADILKAIMATDLKKHGQDVIKLVPKILERLPEIILNQDSEFEAFSLDTSLGKEFNCNIIIERAQDSKEHKARQAMPGKAAIVVK